MWAIYDIHLNLYWNDESRSWCRIDQATCYSVEERDRRSLWSLRTQWRLVLPHAVL